MKNTINSKKHLKKLFIVCLVILSLLITTKGLIYVVSPDYFTRVNAAEDNNSKYPLKLVYTSPNASIDMVVVPDGYTESEMDKFREDVQRLMIDDLFSIEPYNQFKDDFNIYTIEVPSNKSGFEDPFFGSTFITDPWEMTDFKDRGYVARFVKQYVPSSVTDMVLINSSKYGGRGYYEETPTAQSDVDNEMATGLMVHELSHVIANLDDEYNTGSTVPCTMNHLDEPFCSNCCQKIISELNAKKGTSEKPIVEISGDDKVVDNENQNSGDEKIVDNEDQNSGDEKIVDNEDQDSADEKIVDNENQNSTDEKVVDNDDIDNVPKTADKTAVTAAIVLGLMSLICIRIYKKRKAI